MGSIMGGLVRMVVVVVCVCGVGWGGGGDIVQTLYGQ